ncbi:ThuA domain-containing protein [Paenibacillus sp. XY044]|uniref:ThuA domain-containing protein n=1 Tax=Paenibacillus sp. XY044 TaxID=2026089 RepID=UPI000B997AAE|nr:ThuA domain-containing protein [Paenibacillus sp. XY044]OZB94395.1 trehalose utilization [Paenibacillus sp. XY044]
MKTIWAVIGDFYHEAGPARTSLEQVLKPILANGQTELRYKEVSDLAAGQLEQKPDLVILFAENRLEPQSDPEATWMTEDIGRQIETYVSGGGAWLAWHSGLASYPEDGAYVNMLRGYFLSHPEAHSDVTYTPVGGSALGELDNAFRFKDEHYFVSCSEQESEVFLRSSSRDGESAAGWLHSYGQGRVACVTPAHLPKGLLNEGFVRLMQRVIAWSLELELVDA